VLLKFSIKCAIRYWKMVKNLRIQIVNLGGVFASIEDFVPVCAVCISTHKHSVPQSLLSVKKRFEAVCSYALLAPIRNFLSKEVKVILNDNILAWFNVVLFWKINDNI